MRGLCCGRLFFRFILSDALVSDGLHNCGALIRISYKSFPCRRREKTLVEVQKKA